MPAAGTGGSSLGPEDQAPADSYIRLKTIHLEGAYRAAGGDAMIFLLYCLQD
jgi:hypothetical protein